MKLSKLMLSAALVVASAATAHAAPDWCSVPNVNRQSTTDVASLYRETRAYEALYTIVAATCNPDAEARGQARQIEATRQAWSKKLHLTEADWHDVAAWATEGRELRRDGQLRRAEPKAAYSSYSPIDQFELLSRASDPAYRADAFGARLSLAGRMAYVKRCLAGKPLDWAMCQADVAAFDAERLSSEVRADKAHDGFHRTRLWIEAYDLAAQLPEHAKAVQALIAKDPGYAKMFELATAAGKEFAQASPALIDQMTKLDDAVVTESRRASEGCRDRTWASFAGVITRMPAKQFTGITPTITDPFLGQVMAKVLASPDGYLAALALTTCAVLEERPDYLIRTLGSMLTAWPGHRGPRTAAHTAVLSAGIQLDDRNARIDMPSVDRGWITAANYGSGGGGTGTILSAQPSGDTVTVTFQKIKGTQQKCVRGRSTNRITQIRSDGTFVYEYICLEERTETYAEPPAPPQKVDPRYAAGLAPGMFVSTVESVVLSAYAKGAKLPSLILGVPVK